MKKAKSKQFESIKSVLIALIAALILRQFVLASYNVPTGSMKDTIMIGDFMFVNKFVYGARTPTWLGVPFTDTGVRLPFVKFPGFLDPTKGDIVVFEYPEAPHLDYIKRCIAIGGEKIELREGNVFVDSVPEGKREFVGLEYDRIKQEQVRYTRITRDDGDTYVIRQRVKPAPDARMNNISPIPVPQEGFFMMGDNRDDSSDSRVWGHVPDPLVVGKPLIIWMSWDSNSTQFSDKVRWDRLGSLIR